MYTKLVSETAFTLKFIWNRLSIYHLHHLLGIMYKSIFFNLNMTLNYWFISKTINMRGNVI